MKTEIFDKYHDDNESTITNEIDERLSIDITMKILLTYY